MHRSGGIIFQNDAVKIVHLKIRLRYSQERLLLGFLLPAKPTLPICGQNNNTTQVGAWGANFYSARRRARVGRGPWDASFRSARRQARVGGVRGMTVFTRLGGGRGSVRVRGMQVFTRLHAFCNLLLLV